MSIESRRARARSAWKGWFSMMPLGSRRLPIAATIAIALAGSARADLVGVQDFSDLVLWAGSGTNSAAFVLQFSGTESPTAVAWGYRWSGSSTMQSMMDALAGTTTVANGQSPPPGLDDRLAIAMTYWAAYGGVFLDSISYDQAGLPPSWSPAMREIADNYFNDGTYPVLYTRADAGGAWLGGGESQAMSFTYSEVGASDILLTPGGWYGWVQANGAGTFAFAQPVAAVPEPAGIALAASGGIAVALAWRRCRRRAR